MLLNYDPGKSCVTNVKTVLLLKKKGIRKGSSASDSSKYEDKKQRNESVTTVKKKLKLTIKWMGKTKMKAKKEMLLRFQILLTAEAE